FLNFIQIQIRNDDFLFIARALRNDLAARRAEITLAIELTDVPRMLASNAVDRADEVTIRHRMGRLLELPEVFTQTGNRSRRIKHNLRSVQTQGPRAFREVTIVADVHADIRELRFENGKAE